MACRPVPLPPASQRRRAGRAGRPPPSPATAPPTQLKAEQDNQCRGPHQRRQLAADSARASASTHRVTPATRDTRGEGEGGDAPQQQHAQSTVASTAIGASNQRCAAFAARMPDRAGPGGSPRSPAPPPAHTPAARVPPDRQQHVHACRLPRPPDPLAHRDRSDPNRADEQSGHDRGHDAMSSTVIAISATASVTSRLMTIITGSSLQSRPSARRPAGCGSLIAGPWSLVVSDSRMYLHSALDLQWRAPDGNTRVPPANDQRPNDSALHPLYPVSWRCFRSGSAG